jgi:hypothetical protein
MRLFHYTCLLRHAPMLSYMKYEAEKTAFSTMSSLEGKFTCCRHLDDKNDLFCEVFLDERLRVRIRYLQCSITLTLGSWVQILVVAQM